MPPVRPIAQDPPEPRLAAPAAPDGRAPLPLRTAVPRPANVAAIPAISPSAQARDERQRPTFTAGERLAVASAITGGDESSAGGASRPRFGTARVVLLTALLVLAGIGATTVYRAILGILYG